MGLYKYNILTYIPHYNTIWSIFAALNILCALPVHLAPTLSHSLLALATTDLFIVSIVLPFPDVI